MRTERHLNGCTKSQETAQRPDDGFLLCSSVTEPSRLTYRIVVYSSDEAVPEQRFVAYITVPTKALKTGALSERRLGISFAAADSETARANAEAHWQAEIDRERGKLEAALKRGEALRSRRASLADATSESHTQAPRHG